MKIFWSVLISCALFSQALAADKPQEGLRVVATSSLVADWVQNVVQGQVKVTVLVGPDMDIHSFEPTAADNVALRNADITFEIGLGLEHWMGKLYAASDTKAKRVVLSHQVISLPLKNRDGASEDVDPHVWQNVRYVMAMVKKIDSVLESADPAHADVYQQNTKAYLKQLEELDDWIMQQVSQIPRSRRLLVSNHDSLGYFCERYQFRFIGAAFDSSTTEAEDPSAKDMADLIQKIKQAHVHVVFSENIANPKFIASLAKEANARLAPLLYTDALGQKGSAAHSYTQMMRYNVSILVEELMKG